MLFCFDEFDDSVEYLNLLNERKTKIMKQMKEIIDEPIDSFMENNANHNIINNNNAMKKSNKSNQNDILEQLNSLTDILTIKDLQTIIQGPIPNEQMMIIATTNDFEKIAKISPALVRHGRMTRVKFDYPCQTVLDQISNYYFKKPLGFSIGKLVNVSTSEIVQICMELLDSENTMKQKHKSFQNKIKSIYKLRVIKKKNKTK